MSDSAERLAELEAALAEAKQQVRDKSAELAAEQEKAASAEATKAKFLATLSHELRTPLNAIIGFSELMKGEQLGPIGTENYKIYLQDIHDSGTHLLSLVDDLLNVSRMQAGRLEMEDSEVETAELIESVARLLGPETRKKKQRIDVRLAPNLGAILGDERALRQMLINIMGNAIKFSSENSHIVVTAKDNTDDGLDIIVSDSGVGISAEKIEKVFEPFFQGSDALSRSHEGAGLGLSIARTVAEHHDADVSIQSEQGVGTSVTIRFPATRILGDSELFDQTRFDDDDEVDMSAVLLVRHTAGESRIYQDGGEYIIGRPDPRRPDLICDLPLSSNRVSRPHARIIHSGGKFYIVDQSRGGTWIVRGNGQPEFVHQGASAALEEAGAIYVGGEPAEADAIRIDFSLAAAAGEDTSTHMREAS